MRRVIWSTYGNDKRTGAEGRGTGTGRSGVGESFEEMIWSQSTYGDIPMYKETKEEEISVPPPPAITKTGSRGAVTKTRPQPVKRPPISPTRIVTQELAMVALLGVPHC